MARPSFRGSFPGSFPDLRHVRYVTLAASPPAQAPSDIPLITRVLRNALLGAFAGGTLALQVTGRSLSGLTMGGAIGAASALIRQVHQRARGRGFALVPWGILLDAESDLTAIRWSGVHSLDVRYHASRDGSVHARVEVESVVGSFVGFASDAVDLGALAGDLAAVANASARPVAIDLEGQRGAHDGEPFVERVLDAARNILASEGDQRLGLEPASYRDAFGPPSGGGARVAEARVADTLHDIGVQAAGSADVWGLVSALAGELRLRSFAPHLGRLANNPHPAIAALARAALGRLPGRVGGAGNAGGGGGASEDVEGDHEPREPEENDALSWFVSPDEIARLRVWRDQPA